jgi:DNA repair protein SbcC/Rad50
MIENIELVNFISHKDTSIPLEDGVNVFIGANGAGKSSVVDAITYALYGAHTRDSARNILRRGAAGGSASVKFSIGSREYLAERRFGKAGKLESATLRELAPNPRLIVAGERRQYEESMSEEVTKAFGLDYEKMKVATIVQQGELDAVIRYKPKELKELLNSLIGIDRLDLAFQNMREALDGFRLKLRGECMNFDDQSMEALKEEIRSTAQKQEESVAQVKEISTSLSKLEQEREKLETELAAIEPLRVKKKESEERKADLVKYVRNKVSELGSEAQELDGVIDKAKAYLPVLASKERVESEGNSLEEEERKLGQARTDVTSDLRSARTAAERARTLEGEIHEEVGKIKDLTAKAQRRRTEITKLKSIKVPTPETAERLNRKLKRLEGSVEGLKENLTKIGEAVGNYKLIQTQGICPTCGSTVEEINLDAKLAAKHKEHLEAKSKYEEASREKGSVKELLKRREEYDAAQKRLGEQNELLGDYIRELTTEKKKLLSRRKEAGAKSAEARNEARLRRRLTSVESKVTKLGGKKRSFRNRQTALVEAETWLREQKVATKADVKQLGRRLVGLQRTIQSIPKDLTNSEAKSLAIDGYSSGLATTVTKLEREASRFDEASYHNMRKELEEQTRPEITRMTGDLGGWRRQSAEAVERLSKLKEIQTKLEEAASYIRLFEKIRTDVYNRDGILATSLRSWALKELSRNASDYIRSFGIGLSELQLKEQKHDVNIECYSASGMADVKSMSGGEGVAIALALRFAMARLMGKGMVDFIALDEPTTHLDEERRRSLVRLVTQFNSDEKRTSLNQIIVITHDSEIFEDSEVNAVFQFEKVADITTVTKS